MSKVLRCYRTISNLEKNVLQDRIKAEVRKQLVEQLAESIVNDKMEERVGDYSTEYVVSLIVLSPDEYHQEIERKAHELMRYIK